MNTTIEEASNKIWNGGSKLTHNQIDEILTELAATLYTELAEEVEGLKEQDECLGKERKDCPWCSRNMYCRDRKETIGHNEGIDAAATLIKGKALAGKE